MRQLLLVLAACCVSAAAQAQSADEVLIPQVAFGESAPNVMDHTSVNLLNLSDRWLEVELVLTQDDGAPLNAYFCGSSIPFTFCETNRVLVWLEPLQSREIGTSRILRTPLRAGWGTLRVRDEAGGGVDASLVGVQVNLGTTRSEHDLLNLVGYEPPSPLSSAFSTLGRIRSTSSVTLGIRTTWVALLNPSETETAEVRLQLLDPLRARFERQLTIPPKSRFSGFLNAPALFPEAAEFDGGLDVESSTPLAALILESQRDFLNPAGQTFYTQVPAYPRRTAGETPPYLRAEPNPIQVCEGRLGQTTLRWNSPHTMRVQIRVDSPDGPLFARGRSVGSAQTGKWVADGTVFYLLADFGALLSRLTVHVTSEGCP